mgnify:CR=1 FL=1
MIRTYLFDQDEWESCYGMVIKQDFYLMNFFEDDVYLGALKFNGSYTLDFSTVKASELESRYWTLYE